MPGLSGIADPFLNTATQEKEFGISYNNNLKE